ncbi:CPBP family intramembrane glutamic endopeptidase [Candidatus Uabimicrobium amorphum]|uniref:CAAX prenyl protease 2/Lysostaphin resistance protein A-like domain-containing protein n=1 Tax=Uabimicrobium amorphum TaxID=2596890 RepID=A0A5S9ISY5_UABAM|nr:type II CAAX endopeptidase family protein [Candidatus Uabimicrobium amorphum]BBM87568.1 hypothetical protein UABAM_05980 [Candidatus Uabimicrobium amorphum]
MSFVKITLASATFIFLSTSIFIPLVYWTLALFAPTLDFQKVASRTMLITVILFSCFLYKRFAIGRDRLGYAHFSRPVFRNMLISAFCGAAIISILYITQHLLGARILEKEFRHTVFFSAFVSAFLVSIIEETIFRGLVYSALENNFNTKIAIALSAAFYSIVHFFKAKDGYFDVVTWKSGFLAWYKIYQNITDGHIMSSVLCLWALGICFALIRKISGHIFYCIGFHFGIVFALKMASEYTKRVTDYEYTWFVRGDVPIASYLTFFLLLFVIVILLVIIKLRNTPAVPQKRFLGVWLLFVFMCGLWVSQLQNTIYLFNPRYFHRIQINDKYRKKRQRIVVKKDVPIRINGITASTEPLANVEIRFRGKSYLPKKNALPNFVDTNRHKYNDFCRRHRKRQLPEFSPNYTYSLQIETKNIPRGLYEVHIGTTFHNNTNTDYFIYYYIRIK